MGQAIYVWDGAAKWDNYIGFQVKKEKGKKYTFRSEGNQDGFPRRET
jgi:hypothetical protein